MKTSLSQSNVLVNLSSEMEAITVRDVLAKLSVEQLVEQSVHFPLVKEQLERSEALLKELLSESENDKPKEKPVSKKVGAGAKKSNKK
jgi:hypothetical protein